MCPESPRCTNFLSGTSSSRRNSHRATRNSVGGVGSGAAEAKSSDSWRDAGVRRRLFSFCVFLYLLIHGTKKTERITRRHTPREVRPFRVHGQPTRSRVHWHVHKSSFPEEDNKGDTSCLFMVLRVRNGNMCERGDGAELIK